MKDDNTVVTCLGWIALLAATVGLGLPLSGWVLSVMWAWFVVPVFHLPALGVAQAIGLSCIVSFFKSYKSGDGKKKTTTETVIDLIGTAFAAPLFALGFAYIIHLFIGG